MNTIDIDTLCINYDPHAVHGCGPKGEFRPSRHTDNMAPVAYCLWQRFLRFDPEDPIWPNRDRFVLSIGHASMLLYAILHLCGVKAVNPKYERLGHLSVALDDIQGFRRLGSKCPDHPKYRWTSGVETTTGPLGQGEATSVGMAIAAQWMAAYFNRPGFRMFDYDVYALCGDDDMMEGVSGEAASLAGHLRLSSLCWIYDNNKITIAGPADWAFSEDVGARFIGYGWNVTRAGDANDLERLEGASKTFHGTQDRPTLIIVDSHIAFGSPGKQDTSAAHGKPPGEEEIEFTKRNYGWPEDAEFLIPDGVREHFQQGIGKRGHDLRQDWIAKFTKYEAGYPELSAQLYQMQHRQLPSGWDKGLPEFPEDSKGIAGREVSGKALNVMAQNVPWLIGGSADPAPSTQTRLTFEHAGDFASGNYGGRNMHFGIREQAMAAVLNGLSLSKVRAYGSGFLIFSDYSRPSIRLGAIMKIPVIYILTHDSIGIGEDGPTHQPVEQLASLRAIPGLITLGPANANEVVEAWRVIIQLHHQPACLVLSRQRLPTLDRSRYAPASGVRKGANILADAKEGKPEVLLLATGSEVALCVHAYEQLAKEGIQARAGVHRAGIHSWLGSIPRTQGRMVGMKTFGASAPLKELQEKFGFTPEAVVATARELLASKT